MGEYPAHAAAAVDGAVAAAAQAQRAWRQRPIPERADIVAAAGDVIARDKDALTDLVSQEAELSSTGSGGITANVKQSLVARNGGSGGIRVYGNPVRRTVSGKLVQVVN